MVNDVVWDPIPAEQEVFYNTFREGELSHDWRPESACWTSAQTDSVPDHPIYDEVEQELRYLPALTDEELAASNVHLHTWPEMPKELGEVEYVDLHALDDDLGNLLNPFAD